MSQRNATTTYICTISIAAFFTTVSSGEVCAAQLSFDVIVKNEVLGNISLETKTRPVPAGTEDAIDGQFVATKNDWKNFLGVDHLNWLQIVTQDSNPPIPIDPRFANNPLKVPYIDTPPSGYLSGWADEEPWYWNEYRIPEELEPFLPWSEYTQLALQSQNNGQILKFSDVPTGAIQANNLKFETFLVGDFGNKTYDFLTSFSWSISLSGGTSTITNIEQGATFTKQYANLVEEQFGYKKVEKLPTYLYSSTLSPGKIDSFTESALQPSAPFVAWTNNFPGINPPKKPDTILGAFNQSGNLIAVNDDGGPFGSNWGSGIKSSVNNDGSLKLKVSGYNDFNFDERNDFSGGPCNGGSGGGGCVRNAPHPQVGKYDLAVKMYQDYLPSRSSVSTSSSNVGTNTRTFAARSINQEMSFSESDVSDIASLYSDDLPNEKASSKKAEEDALAAAAVPEPTTALGTLFALAVLPVIKRLKNRKNQE
ncbi:MULTISPECIES: hypothetical protein [unclassified Microcoleus]|uniref:hypothetical protein n=1 Tax=unclassified Microcoleus TaxID=2642155 RepID=UPI002FD0B245